jgi:hypothetical protein
MKGTCTRCGKQNVDPIFPHTCTPKALVLADKLEHQVYHGSYDWERVEPMMLQAAAELRRLHEEAEELRYDRKELRKIAEILEAQERFLGGWDSIVKQAFARIDADEAIMRQALEALKELQYAATTDKAFAMADAAIDALKERLK